MPGIKRSINTSESDKSGYKLRRSSANKKIKIYVEKKETDKLFESLFPGNCAAFKLITIEEANAKDGFKQSLLMRAVELGDLGIVRALIERGADTNWEDRNGNTILHVAIEEGNLEIVKELLKSNIDVNVVNVDGMTPMSIFPEGDRDIVIRFLQYKEDENALIDMFRVAIEEGNYKELDLFLSILSVPFLEAKIFASDTEDEAPLDRTALQRIFTLIRANQSGDERDKYIKTLKILIEHKVDVSTIANELAVKDDRILYYNMLAYQRDIESQSFNKNDIEYDFFKVQDAELLEAVFDRIIFNQCDDIPTHKKAVLDPHHEETYDLLNNPLGFEYYSLIINDEEPSFRQYISENHLILSHAKGNSDLIEKIVNKISLELHLTKFLEFICRRKSNVYKYKVIKILLNAGYDINKSDAIFSAFRDQKALNILTKHGFAFDALDRYGKGLLDRLFSDSKIRDEIFIEFLMLNGAKIERRPENVANTKLVIDTGLAAFYKTPGLYKEVPTTTTGERESFGEISYHDHREMMLKYHATRTIDYANKQFGGFIPKLDTIFNRWTEKGNLFLPADVVNSIGKFFTIPEMRDFSPLCKGTGVTYHKYKSEAELLQDQGYRIIDVEGDGNCFFRAIAHQLEGKEDNHLYYRAMVVEELQRNPDRYFVEGEDSHEYIYDIAQYGNWVDDDRAIRAMANAKQINVEVYNSEGVNVKFDSENGVTNKILKILLVQNHYQSVIKDDFSYVDDSYNALVPSVVIDFDDQEWSHMNFDREVTTSISEGDVGQIMMLFGCAAFLLSTHDTH